MIRHRHGNEWFLFTQHDHALLSGRLAERIAVDSITRPSLSTIQGIALHDCGWPLHDDRPMLNDKGEPLHVFEAPPWLAAQVWSASARRAGNKDSYSGLMVSVHVLNLSAMSMSTHRSPRDVFELNKFQHQQVEFQEELRRMLSMRIDAPLTLGLAKPNTSEQEDRLLFDYRLLRGLDQLSLALLCSNEMFSPIERLFVRPGGQTISIRLDRPSPFHVLVERPIFDAPRLEFSVPFRRLPARPFSNVDDFREAFDAAMTEQANVVIETQGA